MFTRQGFARRVRVARASWLAPDGEGRRFSSPRKSQERGTPALRDHRTDALEFREMSHYPQLHPVKEK